MLVLALMVLAQAGGPKCVTVSSTRVCGYECADNGVVARCTQTAQGVCAKNASSVQCFDPPLWLNALNLTGLPAPSCVSDGTNIACGYDCKREGGKLGCAQTPKGVCQVNYGAVWCADPPPVAYAVQGADVEVPTCKAQEGKVACGYDCKSISGKIACAKTPFGACTENGATVVCFDPSNPVICAKGASTPKPQCLNEGGRQVCGYGCQIASSEPACAQTPDGTCDTSGPGRPTCFDPPVRGGSAVCLEAAGAR